MLNTLISKICLVAFMTDISNKVGPGYPICSSDKPGMSYWAERLSDVRGISYVTMGAEQNGTKAGSISCISNARIGGLR